jgi:repressor of nif and glnA expression
MAIAPDRIRNAILKSLGEQNHPTGAAKLAAMLSKMGISLHPRTIRSHLLELDRDGFTTLASRRSGRILTDRGIQELTNADVFSKMGYIAARIDDLGYRMSYSYRTNRGTVVSNLAIIKDRDLSRALLYIAPVIRAGLGMSRGLGLVRAGGKIGELTVPIGSIALATICSVTINGVLISNGIPVSARFGGLLEIRNGSPLRFVDAIEYSGTTTDPLEMFIKAGMTSVTECARTGNGIIGASFREIPEASLSPAKRMLKRLAENGLDGSLQIGAAGQPLLDIPVTEGRAGFVVAGGINPFAALHEAGIPTVMHSLSKLADVSLFVPIEEVSLLGRRKYPYME